MQDDYKMLLSRYVEQHRNWPSSGRYVLGQFDETTIVVYQAFCPSIAQFAVKNGRFGGGGFSLERMSWIKPGFLWIMYRSGWATKANQEHILAVRIYRRAFDDILAAAVKTTYDPCIYTSQKEWKRAGTLSEVRFQWDPDHDPIGKPLQRRAIQLGLRGSILSSYANEWIINVEDITPFVKEQYAYVASDNLERLMTPSEVIYPVNESIAAQILAS